MEKVTILDLSLHVDDRGWVAWPFADMAFEQTQLRRVHLPCMKPGAVRGNHYHPSTVEFALILTGPCRALFEDNETGERQELLLPVHTPVLFKISANVTHAFKNESSHNILLLCYEQRADSTPDEGTCRKIIL